MSSAESIKTDGSHEFNGVAFVTTDKRLFSNINTMQVKKVKIMRCTPSFAWYRNLIGKTFDTYVINSVYFLRSDCGSNKKTIKGILQQDAQEQFL